MRLKCYKVKQRFYLLRLNKSRVVNEVLRNYWSIFCIKNTCFLIKLEIEMIQTYKRPLSIHLIKRIISITPKKRVLTLLKLYRICGQVLKCLVVLLRCPCPGD